MKKENIYNNPENFTTICITKKDREYLNKLKDKKNVSGIWVTVSQIIQMIKKLKLENKF